MIQSTITYEWLGTVPYDEALALQHRLREQRLAGAIDDRILFLEHPQVITQGKRECVEDFRSPPEVLAREGIAVMRVERGGRLTYHGPGQLIGYCICDVTRYGGVHQFVRSIEEALIAVCAAFGIDAGRDEQHPGVWVKGEKIAAIGLHVSQNISLHGFSLNVSCDLAPYRHIVACGIPDKGITTIEACLGRGVRMQEVLDETTRAMSHALGANLKRMPRTP